MRWCIVKRRLGRILIIMMLHLVCCCHTLLYPINTPTPAASASSFIFWSSATYKNGMHYMNIVSYKNSNAHKQQQETTMPNSKSHRRSTRFLQKNSLTPRLNTFPKQPRIIGRPSTNQCTPRFFGGGQILNRGAKYGTVGGFGGFRPFIEFGTAWGGGTGSEEVGFDDVVEGGGGASLILVLLLIWWRNVVLFWSRLDRGMWDMNENGNCLRMHMISKSIEQRFDICKLLSIYIHIRKRHM